MREVPVTPRKEKVVLNSGKFSFRWRQICKILDGMVICKINLFVLWPLESLLLLLGDAFDRLNECAKPEI
jgi:hypothetical protein